jgi:hypothetical protein
MMNDVAAAQSLGIRDSRARTFAVALIIALAAHLPWTPFPFIVRLIGIYLNRSDTSWDYKDDRVIIPISLVEDVPTPAEPGPPPEAVTPAPAVPEARAQKRQEANDPHRDAGAPDAATAEDAALVEAASARRLHREAGTSSLADAGRDGSGPSVKDTMSLVGGLKRTVQGKPNVALVVWFSTIREHPLGPLVGNVIACNQQWQDFMGNLIDPLRDLDGVMLVGPRMSDTSKLTILAQHHLDESRASEILASLGDMARKNGTGGPVPGGQAGILAVRFHADRADRIALTHPRNMIIVTPPDGFTQLRDDPEPMSLPAGHGQAMSLTMVTPWRPARAVGAHLPESLSEIRVNIFAAPDGGVNAQIEFDDQDPTLAKAHASDVTEQVRAVGGLLLGDIQFVAQANHIVAQTHLARITSALALGFVRQMICPSGFDAGARSF